VGEALPRLLEICQILHQCGDNPETGDHRWLQERTQTLPARLGARYALRPYVGSELRDVYAAATLVVGRSGAGTVNECCNLGLPAVLVPLPGAGGDEQTANARLVEKAGGAVVLPQPELSPEGLVDLLTRLLTRRTELAAMGTRARTLAAPDAAERLARLIREVAAP
jgi:UDP-N-acetylglucosamine--N-acetylmuramyl-(pentapeptide) pyrophosphoryl-undecaprenol N-acetylglucosamine transferase